MCTVQADGERKSVENSFGAHLFNFQCNNFYFEDVVIIMMCLPVYFNMFNEIYTVWSSSTGLARPSLN